MWHNLEPLESGLKHFWNLQQNLRLLPHLEAKASDLLAMVSILVAMASTLVALASPPQRETENVRRVVLSPWILTGEDLYVYHTM